jgi:hypothetical protein
MNLRRVFNAALALGIAVIVAALWIFADVYQWLWGGL